MGAIGKKKLKTGVLAVPPIIFLIIIAPAAVIFVMVLVATFLGSGNSTTWRPQDRRPRGIAGWVLGLLISLFYPLGGMAAAGPLLAGVLLVLSILFMATSRDLSSVVTRLGITVLGIVYVSFLLSTSPLFG